MSKDEGFGTLKFPDLDDIIKKYEMPEYIRKAMLIPGWTTPWELHEMCKLSKDKVVIEIGSYCGRASYALASVAKKLFCIDNYMEGGKEEFEKNMKEFKNYSLILGNSTTVYHMFNLESIDVLLIDGDHSYIGVKYDLENYFPKVKINGKIICHDYKSGIIPNADYPEVKRAVDEFTNVADMYVDSSVFFTKIRR